MDNKVIHVDFNSTSRKTKSSPKNNGHKITTQKKSFFDLIIDKFKALFGKSRKDKYLKKANPQYKHWL